MDLKVFISNVFILLLVIIICKFKLSKYAFNLSVNHKYIFTISEFIIYVAISFGLLILITIESFTVLLVYLNYHINIYLDFPTHVPLGVVCGVFVTANAYGIYKLLTLLLKQKGIKIVSS